MAELTILPSDDEDFDAPSYTVPGRALFRYDPTLAENPWGVELLDHDGCVFWLVEGGFPDQVIRNLIDLELAGTYVLEGVLGHVSRSYEGEYDEEWTFELCRRASREEINTEALDPS